MSLPADPPILGMILKGYPRISDTFISNEIGLLEQRGIPIHIFSMRKPREAFCHPSVREIRARLENHGCGHHRTGQRPSPHLVHAGDESTAGSPQAVFKFPT